MTDPLLRSQIPDEALPLSTSDRPLSTSDRRPDFPAVYSEQFSYVWKTLRRLGVVPRDLEDVVHDLFIVVHRHLAEYDVSRPLRPWLFGIAVRVVADYRRSAHRAHEPLHTDADPPPEPPVAEEKVAAREARALLVRALDTLDLDRRAVFVMHELDEITVPDIAATLGLPLNTAYSRLRLARAEVAACVRRLRSMEERRG